MKRFIFITILFYAAFFTFISYSTSKAYFASMAAASGNSFTAASQFPTTSPDATPTASVTPSITETPTPTITPSIQPGNVLLNEIQFKPTVASQEWVEVYNAGDTSVDLSGWSIIDLAGGTKSLTSLGIIAPNSYKTLEINDTLLNNSGEETITLRNSSAQSVDTHSFNGGSIASNQTIGKNPDGTGSWKACAAISKNTTNNGVC